MSGCLFLSLCNLFPFGENLNRNRSDQITCFILNEVRIVRMFEELVRLTKNVKIVDKMPFLLS